MEKLGWDHECVHKDFALEANDILRDVWNDGLFNNNPQMKERLRKLLQVRENQKA